MITPLTNNVIVKKRIIDDGIDEKTGIFIVRRSVHEDYYYVIAVGPKCQQPLCPGDLVLIPATAPGEIIHHEGEVLKCVSENVIVARVDE